MNLTFPRTGLVAVANGIPQEPPNIRLVIANMRAEFGLQFRSIANLLLLLSRQQQGLSVDEIVRYSHLPLRTIHDVRNSLSPWLIQTESADELFILNHEAKHYIEEHIVDTGPPFRYSPNSSSDLDDLKNVMAEVIEGAPRPLVDLDHVPASPLTVALRGLFLSQLYELQDASILFLGDHDLTSIALCMASDSLQRAIPQCTVVDIDDRTLDYINFWAVRKKFPIRTVFSDLRVELPTTTVNNSDLVFSDPPYTPQGMRLFAARAIQGINKNEYSRILLCYGFSSRHPALGLKIQKQLMHLNLVFESIYPVFNSYLGAMAVGSSADLYICRPTRTSLPAAERESSKKVKIYTRGEQAIESKDKEINETIRSEIKNALSGDRLERMLSVEMELPNSKQMGFSEYVQNARETINSSYSTEIINVLSYDPGYVFRLPLLSKAETVIIVFDAEYATSFNKDSKLYNLISIKYTLVKRFAGQGQAYVILELAKEGFSSSPMIGILQHIIQEPARVLGDTWAQGAESVATSLLGFSPPREDIRKAITETVTGRLSKDSLLYELSSGHLSRLSDDVRQSWESIKSLRNR